MQEEIIMAEEQLKHDALEYIDVSDRRTLGGLSKCLR